jgi:pilus assembly protein CpaB
MNKTKLILASLGVALFALMLVFSYLYKQEKRILSLAAPVKVVVAVKDIPEGTAVDDSMLDVVEAPKQFVQPGAMTERAQAFDRVTSVPVLAGTQLLESMFRETRLESVARKIPADKRAFSIAVNDVTAVAGLISPGDFVDVYLTASLGSTQQGRTVTEGTVTRNLLQNVLVLAVNQDTTSGTIQRPVTRQQAEGSAVSQAGRSASDRSAIRTLTLALAPDDAQRAALAQEVGQLSVSLRYSGQKADSVQTQYNVNAQQLLGVDKAIVPKSRASWTEMRGTEEYQLR